MPASEEDMGHNGIWLGRGSTLGLADIRIENGMVCIIHIFGYEDNTNITPERNMARWSSTSLLQEHPLLAKHCRNAN